MALTPLVGIETGRFPPVSVAGCCYTEAMMDELEFRTLVETALEALKQHLFAREEEDEAGFEVEEQNGVLNVLFDEPPDKFVITPNTPVRQIWISALSTSFKLDWDGAAFVLARTGERLTPLVDRLIEEHLER
jgi:CyaY protein